MIETNGLNGWNRLITCETINPEPNQHSICSTKNEAEDRKQMRVLNLKKKLKTVIFPKKKLKTKEKGLSFPFIEKEWKKMLNEWNLNTDYRRMWNATFIYKKKLIKKKKWMIEQFNGNNWNWSKSWTWQ